MLKDLDSGRILFSRGADQRFTPASMAKVMTAYVVIDLIEKGELSRDKLFTVEDATWKLWSARSGQSTTFLRAGEQVSFADLLNGMLTASRNEVASVLAVGFAGRIPAFVKRMHNKAAKIAL